MPGDTVWHCVPRRYSRPPHSFQSAYQLKGEFPKNAAGDPPGHSARNFFSKGRDNLSIIYRSNRHTSSRGDQGHQIMTGASALRRPRKGPPLGLLLLASGHLARLPGIGWRYKGIGSPEPGLPALQAGPAPGEVQLY